MHERVIPILNLINFHRSLLMKENKTYNCEDEYKEIMGMWNVLLEEAAWISADHEMSECIVELFYKAMARTFRFLKLKRPKNDDIYTKFDLGLYGAVTAYSYYYPAKRPLSNTDEAYFFEASVFATHNLRKCFFDRSSLENSIVYADNSNDKSVEEIDVRFPYDFENGDLLPIAKVLRALDSST